MKLIKVSDRLYVNPDVVQYVHLRPSTYDGTYFYGVYINTADRPELRVEEKLSLPEAESLLQKTVSKLTQED